jgi:rubrerythrin
MNFVTLEEIISFAVEREDTAYRLYNRAAELEQLYDEHVLTEG